jgi:transcriptional regulator with XRE-family HTH domain
MTEALTIRSKMLGVLIRDARVAAAKTTAECAQPLGISEDQFAAYERGAQPISLPELEVLAVLLRVPLGHFWGDALLAEATPDTSSWAEIVSVRHRMIGLQLRQARMEAGLTPDDCANALGTTAERIKSFESGREPVPLPELELLADFLHVRLETLVAESGPIADQLKALQAHADFASLPPEVRDFILEDTQQSYVRLARRLSELPREGLRQLGEAILETVT